MARRCDVVIVGGGFAGAAAACQLAASGIDVAMAEARDRVGGRAYSRPFSGSGEIVELGGAWITPWQRRIRGHAERCGITLRPRAPVSRRAWHDGQTLSAVRPCGVEEERSYRASMQRLEEDSEAYAAGRRVDRQGGSLSEVSLDAYLDRIEAGQAARAQIMAWWMISGNGDPGVVSAAEFLSSCAYGGGKPEGMLDKLCHTLAPGASVLVERMIAGSGAKLHLAWPAHGIHQQADGVAVTAADGRRIEARFAILAVPHNTIGDLVFEPALSPRKAKAAGRRHAGATAKLWIKARNVEIGTLVTGGEAGLPWMFAERSTDDGATLIVGFGLKRGGFDPDREEHVRDALHRLLPEAELLAWDRHDWVADPYSRGTWVALPADALDIADPEVWMPEGRLLFAGSDISHEEPGWFEAAIASGEAAAVLARRKLDEPALAKLSISL